jgi:hypothetical protein
MAKKPDPIAAGALHHIFHNGCCPFHRAHVISVADPTAPTAPPSPAGALISRAGPSPSK